MSAKTVGLMLASSCLIYSGADAAGLGKLTVLSALGQPLRAEIELTSVAKEDASSMMPKVASFDAFRKANIDYSANLSSLRFSVVDRGARHFVLITSTQSINEPFLELLLELNSSSGRLIREYTLLFDPVEMQANNAASSTANKADASPVTAPLIAPDNSTLAESTPTTKPIQKKSAQADDGSGDVAKNSVKHGQRHEEQDSSESAKGTAYYQVKSGDTLRKIASQFKHKGISLDQMLVALQRSNSRAFINGNMNLVRAGAILTVPEKIDAEVVSQAESHKMVLAQSVDFNAYRNKLANQVVDSGAQKSAEGKKTDAGKITAKVVEPSTQANESKDKLKLSKAQLPDNTGNKASEEDKIAKQSALDAANARVKELEQNTVKLQKLLEMQSKSPALPTTTSPAVSAPTGTTSTTPPVAETPAVKTPVAEPVPVTTPSAASSVKETEPAATPVVAPPVEASAAASAKPVHKVAKPNVAVAQPVEPAPGFFDNWIRYIPYGAGLLALLGGLGIYANKRKKKPEPFDDETLLTDASIKANSLFGSTGGQSVDTNNSVFNSNFAPSASQLDANEVDPVAEADVYIAYGRDEQAEEILKEALRTQPDRQAVRVKLLEIYAHRKDLRTFEIVASELYALTGGEGPDWAQTASLGVIIDPQNPLYAGGQAPENGAALGAATLPMESLTPEELAGMENTSAMLETTSAKQDTTSHSSLLPEADAKSKENLDDTLDFDLGLTTIAAINPEDLTEAPFAQHVGEETTVTGEKIKKAESLPSAVADASDDLSPASLEVDTVIQHPGQEVGEQSTAKAPVSSEEGLDFEALDFDAPKNAQAESTPSVVADQQFAESPALAVPTAAVPTSASSTEPAAATPAAFEFDLSGIDFELTNVSASTSTPTQNAQKGEVASALPDLPTPIASQAAPVDPMGGAELQVDFGDVSSDSASKADVSSEMATKLDLAIAYQEIGDKDGARELLEEVMKGGTPEQLDRAKAIMLELA